MENNQIRQLIRQELPSILQRDPEMRAWVLSLTQEQYADKQETESRFDRLLDELRRDREAQTRKWEENRQELRVMREEQNRKWEENRQELRVMREEQTRKWEENQQELRAMREENQQELRAMREENQQELQVMREEQNRKWEEQNRKWEEQNRKWDENQATLNAMLEEIHALSRKHDSTIGALGARWGLHTEQAFRNALKGILKDSFGVEVLNVTEFDDKGEVFGRPDQVELDVIILDGTLILCEIKSSMSKSDMYAFERKVRFYEKHHNRKAHRALVISPMVDRRAQDVAQKLGIEVYSYAEDVDPAVFG